MKDIVFTVSKKFYTNFVIYSMDRNNRKKGLYFKHYKELYKLIPIIQKTTKESIEMERGVLLHNINRITEEREHLKLFFNLIQGKWTFDILHILNIMGEINYNEIKKVLKSISSRILTDRLKLLEMKGFVERNIHNTRPVHISYKLTEFGEGLVELMIPVVLYFLLNVK
jgi:DNA-binding HxlR family transcriptional regulator